MRLPTVSHIAWKVAVEPVKWMPARSGEASAGSPTSPPAPGTMLMTPGGSPAASKISMMTWAAYTAVDAGFHSTVLPMIAGAVGRLPPIEVKLNGVTAKTNPSSGRSEEHTSELQSPYDLVC